MTELLIPLMRDFEIKERLNPENINIALIGCGAYARSCYVNYFLTNKDPSVRLAACIDISTEKTVVSKHLDAFSNVDRPTEYYLDSPGIDNQDLITLLNSLRQRHNINTVILSTPPDKRLSYINWALDNDLNILSDKPLTAVPNCSTDIEAARQLFSEYITISRKYEESIARRPDIVFDLMVQRRFHPIFQLIMHNIEEVAEYTGCALTHFQNTHADGQWRLPNEIIDIDYHGFSDGTGKTSHSGYHFFDLVSMNVRNSMRAAGKKADEVTVYSQPTFPNDYIQMIGYDTYRKVFGDVFDQVNKYSPEEYDRLTEGYGELDCVANITFKNEGKRLASGNINLLHSSFSGRYWADPNLDDLYRSNGRLRQELHFLVQGPFQSISLSSLRGCSKVPVHRRIDEGSSREPLQLEIFRNNGVNPRWKAYERYTIESLIPDIENPDAHLGWARHNCIRTFLGNIAMQVPRERRISDLLDHELSMAIFSAACESLAQEDIVRRAIKTA